MNDDEREIERMIRHNQEQFEAVCKEHNFTEDERQALKDKLEMAELVLKEHARELANYLASDDESSKYTAALKIIDLVKGEILASITPFIETFHERLREIEERLALILTG